MKPQKVCQIGITSFCCPAGERTLFPSDRLSPGLSAGPLAHWSCAGITVPWDAMVSMLVAAVRDGEKKQTSALTNTGSSFFSLGLSTCSHSVAGHFFDTYKSSCFTETAHSKVCSSQGNVF